MTESPVLLVEDDPSDFRLIQRAFARLDQPLNITRLTNGDEVVDYLAGRPPYENRALYPIPSLVLLDIKLPRRSGFEVLSWIRSQRSAIKRLPVVILSSSLHSADINRAYDLGANSYLAKPETAAKLAEMVSHVQAYWFLYNQAPDLSDGLAAGGVR
jgi:CheY-like chemotaxis protein